MKFFIFSRLTADTGRLLVEEVGVPGGIEPPRERIGLLIRWGSTARIPYHPHRVINHRHSILNAVDKLRSLEILQRAGVRVPEFSVSPLPFPCMARTRRHQGGSGLKLCLQNRDVEAARRDGFDYFIKYIPTRKEFRVHVFGFEILGVAKKVPEPDPHPFVCNHANGWKLRYIEQYSGELGEMGVQAVNALGLDFGAVDILLSDDGQYYVLEVNSAPGLDPELEIFQRYVWKFQTYL